MVLQASVACHRFSQGRLSRPRWVTSGHTDKSAPRFTPNVREAAQNPIRRLPLQNNTNFDLGRSEHTQRRPQHSTGGRYRQPCLGSVFTSLLEAVIMLIGRTQRSRLYCMNSADPAAGVRQRVDWKALGVLPMSRGFAFDSGLWRSRCCRSVSKPRLFISHRCKKRRLISYWCGTGVALVSIVAPMVIVFRAASWLRLLW